MFFRKGLLTIAGIILAYGMGAFSAFAQEPQSQSQSEPRQDEAIRKDRSERMQKRRERLERREGLKGHLRARHMGCLLDKLNLTEEQRQQGRAIMQRRLETTKAQREELFKLREKRIAGTFTADDEARAKALHQEIRTAMEGVRTEMAGVLTAEQRAKLEELKKERKAKIEQRMRERQERRNKLQL
jgi:protein CpxP